MSVDWLADVLRAAGVPVVEYPGWLTRSAAGSFAPRGVIWHHDASPLGPSPSLPRQIAEVGNSTTPPPLSQCWVDVNGVWWILAAGRANHAGTGTGWGRIRANQGNLDAIGVETDHTVGEAWPAAQLSSLRRGTKAILARLGASPADSLCGHKEYAPGRKVDPDGLDMNTERQIVAGPMEDDVSFSEVLTGSFDGKTASFTAGVWLMFANYYAGKASGDAAACRAMLATVLANQQDDLSDQAVLDRLDQTMAAELERLNTEMQQHIAEFTAAVEAARVADRAATEAVIRDVLGEDNAAQADAVVVKLAERLAA